jgi:hypothetical protein
MISRRALLIYNFGLAVILALVGVLSIFVQDAMVQSSRVTDMPTFDAAARKALADEKDLETLRSRSLFYFDVARDLKRARNVETTRLFYDARTLAFLVAGLFALSGVLIIGTTTARYKGGPPQ